MSNTPDSTPVPRRPTADDPFYYGYRYEPVSRRGGKRRSGRISLTPEDQLHPQECDSFTHDTAHGETRDYLSSVFRCRLQHDPHAVVASNQGILWDDPALKHHAPDLAIIFKGRQPALDWIMFDVAAEGTRPHLIVELVTPKFRDNDVVHKFRAYHQARVPLYVICDRTSEEGPWEFRGYSWTPDRYEPLPLDQRGQLWLADFQLGFKAEGLRLRCVDGPSGAEIGDYVEICKALAASNARAKGQSPPS